MPSTEAQRTLVKSPPELWAELSDPASLARHLGDFGEIRIAHVEPEQSVEWEAQEVTGTVALKPSGWGTKVTLTVVRETPEPEALAPEPEPTPEPESSSKPETMPATAPEAESAAVESPPVTRRSKLLARLFRHRRVRVTEIEEPPAAEAEPEQPEPAQEEPPPNLAAELAAELARVEEAMAEQDAELLTAVLDRLGAAHHRPFSRS
ncbi:MAG: hypothetical protein ACRDLF_12995 [Solirubrobacteraceae bacterium]